MRHHNVTAHSFSDEAFINATLTKSNGVSIYIEIKEDIKRPFVTLVINMGSGVSGSIDLQYLNETIDMCRFFQNKAYLPVVQILYRALVEEGNYPTSCPIKKVN